MLVKLHASCSFLHAKKWCWIWILIANAEIDNHLLKSAHLFIVSDDQLTLLNSILSAESLPIFKNPLCLPISPSSSIYRSQKIKNKKLSFTMLLCVTSCTCNLASLVSGGTWTWVLRHFFSRASLWLGLNLICMFLWTKASSNEYMYM